MESGSTKNSTKCSSEIVEEYSESAILLKLRRFKIEENLISKTINKSMNEFYEVCLLNTNAYSELRKFFTNLRSSYVDIRNLFQELKANTIPQENLKDLDIDDVKKDVLALERKITTFKLFVQSELTSLKNKEEELTSQLHEIPNEIDELKRSKIRTKPFTAVVPSPVKVLINSPLKCQEVQRFQDFLMNSKNRTGGWAPYHHNIFAQAWQKYFWIEQQQLKNQEVEVEKIHSFPLFVQELFQKIPGITIDDLIIHSKWYSKYIYLKNLQQRALDKWKTNRKLMKKGRSNKPRSTMDTNKSKASSSGGPHRIPVNFTNRDELSTLVSDEFKEMERRISDQIRSDIIKTIYDDEMMLVDDLQDIVLKDNINDLQPHTSNLCGFVSDQKIKELKKSRESMKNNKNTFYMPTEQWINKCSSKKDSTSSDLNLLDNISRLRVPEWRLVLQEEQ